MSTRREQLFRTASCRDGLSLSLRYLRSAVTPSRGVALFVHGATFPSALSIMHPFDGHSWADALSTDGFDVWGFDFHGYGGSDAYPQMSEPPEEHDPLCTAEDASEQLECAVRFVLGHHGVTRISLVAHSWGTIVACRFAGCFPSLIDRLVLFGPIAQRSGSEVPHYPAWRLVSLKDQWERFTAEVPVGQSAVLSRQHFAGWGERYLDGDSASRSRMPASVKTPSGPWFDIGRAWAGDLRYDPAQVRAPVAIIRGEWDSMCTDVDAAWLFAAFASSPIRRDIKVSRGTHLLHLEANRYALYRETANFLAGGDGPADVP